MSCKVVCTHTYVLSHSGCFVVLQFSDAHAAELELIFTFMFLMHDLHLWVASQLCWHGLKASSPLCLVFAHILPLCAAQACFVCNSTCIIAILLIVTEYFNCIEHCLAKLRCCVVKSPFFLLLCVHDLWDTECNGAVFTALDRWTGFSKEGFISNLIKNADVPFTFH